MKTLSFLFLISLTISFFSCNEQNSTPYSEHYINKIYSIKLDGSHRKLLTLGSDFSLLNNGKIIYINNYRLYTCNSDGSDSVTISPNNFMINEYHFYLDKTKIIIPQINNSNFSFYTINDDGSGLTQLDLPIDIKLNESITLSPNGQQMVYTNNSGIYIINMDGTNKRQINDTVNTFDFHNIKFTPDGSNVIYLKDFKSGFEVDLRLYNIKNMRDTSLFDGNNGSAVRTYRISKWNSLLFSNGDGVNLINLNNFNTTLLHSGGNAYFSNDSTIITFTDFYTSIYIMDLKQNSINQIQVNLPGNYISNPILSSDKKYVYFQADTSWSVIKKLNSNDNIVF